MLLVKIPGKAVAMSKILTAFLIRELSSEYRATKACLERIPAKLYDYKPHPTSMALGYLTLLVAEIPLWIKHMVIDGEIDFAGFKHQSPKDSDEMLAHFEENMKEANAALEATNDEALQEETFTLKRNGQVLYTSKKLADIGVTLNHWVHHRGQLTVYMRLNEIAVPSIYGPSGDDKNFTPPS
jgi:uncharacterized damage-inducible protein DinB